jgi:gluconolactonase
LRTPPSASLLAAREATTIAARTCLLEGPAFDAEDNLYFSDIFGNRIYPLAPDGSLSVFRADSGRTNGNTFDASGRLISWQGAEQGLGVRRRVVRTDLATGKVEVLTDRYEGKRYNSPNDVGVDVHGCIWFTDPCYDKDRSMVEMDQEAVDRIDPGGNVRRVLTQPAIERPNGIESLRSGLLVFAPKHQYRSRATSDLPSKDNCTCWGWYNPLNR